jgi:hypothetical protein
LSTLFLKKIENNFILVYHQLYIQMSNNLMKTMKPKMAKSVQQLREESFERVMNDSVKAQQRNYNVTMRDAYTPGCEVPATAASKK